LYILIGLQRNTLHSKPNQCETPFLQHKVLYGLKQGLGEASEAEERAGGPGIQEK